MSTDLLEILIRTAGPEIARPLVQRLWEQLEKAAEGTDTNVDDQILDLLKSTAQDLLGSERNG